MNNQKKNVPVFLLFIVFALLFTYPLVYQVGSALRGADIHALGDPMFNTWVLAWDVHKISRLDFKGFFNANIFFPQSGTLLYSEHLLPQSLMALPVTLVTGNPVLAYNIVFLLSLALSGFGMFCLVRYLTKNSPAGIVAGLIYAFCPFITSHHYQIQVVSAWGIPFAFLFLHKFFDENRLQDLLLFTFFFIVQVLANGYYALYLTFFGSVWILYQTIARKKYRKWRFWTQMALCAVLIVGATGPFYYHYAKVHDEMAFVRGMDFYARLTSYLAAPRINRLYGKISSPFVKPEGELFPGIVAVVLGILGLFILVKAGRIKSLGLNRTKKIFLGVRRIVHGLMFFSSIIIVFIIGQGGLNIRIGQVQLLRAHNIRRPITLLIILLVARILLDKIFGFQKPKTKNLDLQNIRIYGIILLLSFLFTFGPTGPYLYLYNHVPGFQAVRVTSRFDIFVMFALAVLAAYGMRICIGRLKTVGRVATTALVSLLITAEYISIPIPYHAMPVKDQIPDVYKWLATTQKPKVLIEIPLPRYETGSASKEAARMYFSTYHWNTLVNGYSGWFPHLYTEVCRRWQKMGFKQTIKDLRALGVNYLLFHFDEIRERDRTRFGNRLLRFREDLRLVQQFGDDYVFEVQPKEPEEAEPRSISELKELSRTGWIVHASVGDDRARLALDGSPETRWDSGPQKIGDFFEIDLGKPTCYSCVSLKFGPSGLDFPRGYSMEVSSDGTQWTEVVREDTTILPIRLFAKPKDLTLNIFMPTQETRYIRITNLGQDVKFYWSIYELKIYE